MGPSHSIALFHAPDDRQAWAVQQGMAEALRDTEFALTVRPLSPAAMAEDLCGFLERHAPRGAVLLPPLAHSPEAVAICAQAGCAPLCIAADAPGDPAWTIAADERQAAADAVHWLAAMGHRAIGFVAGPEDCRAARQRELGYIDALADLGLDRGAELIAQGDGHVASGLAAGRLLLDISPRPSAILAASDDMAAGVLQAARERDIAVPEDLSVLGFGDSDLAPLLWPPLSSIAVPLAEMGFAAAMKLADPDEADRQPAWFACSLIPRQSTGPAA